MAVIVIFACFLTACTGVLDELSAEDTLPFFDSASIQRNAADTFDRDKGIDPNGRFSDAEKQIYNNQNWKLQLTLPAGTYGDFNTGRPLYTRLGLVLYHAEGIHYYAVDGPTVTTADLTPVSFQLQICFFESENNLHLLRDADTTALDYYIVISDEPYAGSADVITSNSEKKSFAFLDELFRTESENSFDSKDITNKRNQRRSVYYKSSLNLENPCPDAILKEDKPANSLPQTSENH